MKNPLSKQMTTLLAVFALGGGAVTQTDLLDQFLNEKEGNRLAAYLDSANPPIWTICRGVTRIDG
ncbi:MAG: lysozyme, partial [Leuconostoc mesenteroides]